MKSANCPKPRTHAKAAKEEVALKAATVSAPPAASPPQHSSAPLRRELPAASSAAPPASVPSVPVATVSAPNARSTNWGSTPKTSRAAWGP